MEFHMRSDIDEILLINKRWITSIFRYHLNQKASNENDDLIIFWISKSKSIEVILMNKSLIIRRYFIRKGIFLELYSIETFFGHCKFVIPFKKLLF